MRLSGTDFIEGGIDHVEAAAIARHIEPIVDFLDVSMGSYWRFHKFLSTLDDPLGYEIESSEQVTREVGVPTIVTGRIMTLDHADHLVETGVADMVSIVRAMIADPYLVAKARDGRGTRDPPVHRHEHGMCRPADDHRPSAVRRQRRRRQGTIRRVRDTCPRPVKKKVLVIGGGPRGHRGSRAPPRLRGHEVHLYEMRNHLGGQVRIAASAPHRARPRSDHPASSPTRSPDLGVHVHLRTPVDPDLVIEQHPDEVIVATGLRRRAATASSCRARPCRYPAAILPHVYTVWDVLGFGGRATVGRTRGRLRRHRHLSPARSSRSAGTAVRVGGRSEGGILPFPITVVMAPADRPPDLVAPRCSSEQLAATGWKPARRP